MKSVVVQGGLGNQLFQYCYFFWYKENINSNIKLNFSLLNKEKQHNNVDIRNLLIIKNYINNKNILFSYNFSGILVRILDFLPFQTLLYKERNQELNYKKIKSKYHLGYFQEYKYFNYSKDYIFSEFKKTHLNNNITALHIRRGDFLSSKLKEHKIIDNEYIIKAIEALETKKLHIFTDDIDWVKKSKFFQLFDCQIITANTDIENFIQMTKYNSYILNTSTFGWWAAYINSNNYTKVVFPNIKTRFINNEVNKKIGWKFILI